MIKVLKERSVLSLKSSLCQTLPQPHSIGMWWLGQAGFAFRFNETLIFIDPYLSDFLSKKYKDKIVPHIRMMKPPIIPSEIEGLNLILCTHRHSDHMDPESLPILSKKNPNMSILIPRSEKKWALELGIPDSQLKTIGAGEGFSFMEDIHIEAVPSAHEELKVNEKGEHYYLGYIMKLGNIVFYHSGDCIIYKGLKSLLQNRQIDVAFLPINGRDSFRKHQNIPGNFTLDEAVDLCTQAEIPVLIGHHFGMFDFNIANVEEATQKLKRTCKGVKGFLAEMGTRYLFFK